MILCVRSCGCHCKSERTFCHGSEANKGWGPSFGYARDSAAHNRHHGHQDLVYRIVTPDAARLALFCFNIRKRTSFQPFLALQDLVPASFVSFQLWSGSCNGTQVSNVHPVSMETGRLYQSDGHAPQWLGWGMAQKVETRCYTIKGKLSPKKSRLKKGNDLV